jgi:hypothetical protein
MIFILVNAARDEPHGVSICTRNCIMTRLRFLFRVTLRRLDLAAEIYHIREPEKIPQVMSPDETRRLLAVASSLKVQVLLLPCQMPLGQSQDIPQLESIAAVKKSVAQDKVFVLILVAVRFSFCATRCPCTRPLAFILHALAIHAPDVVQPSHHAKVDDLLDGLRARVSAIIS